MMPRPWSTRLALVLATWSCGLPGLPASAAVSAAEGPAPARSGTAGPAVALEAGRYGGGYGLALAYYFPRPLPALALGGGINGGITAEPRMPAWGANLFAAYGQEHRAMLLIGYALNARRVLRLHAVDAVERALWGPEVAVGYELLNPLGVTFRVLVGGAYLPEATRDGERGHFQRSVTLALGWKLW